MFTKEDLSDIPTFDNPPFPGMAYLNITTQGVEKLLQNINSKKANRPDHLPSTVLKECASEVAPYLQHIFQKSINSHELPKDWLNANVTAIFKKRRPEHTS